MEQLASGTTLLLNASKPSAKAGVDGGIEKITKTVHVRFNEGGGPKCGCCVVSLLTMSLMYTLVDLLDGAMGMTGNLCM